MFQYPLKTFKYMSYFINFVIFEENSPELLWLLLSWLPFMVTKPLSRSKIVFFFFVFEAFAASIVSCTLWTFRKLLNKWWPYCKKANGEESVWLSYFEIFSQMARQSSYLQAVTIRLLQQGLPDLELGLPDQFCSTTDRVTCSTDLFFGYHTDTAYDIFVWIDT